jgi:hypothetical protein
MAKRHTFWDDPKYQRMLKKLAAQELYAKDIAAQMTEHFGFTITKNSVIGRAHRTGVELSQPGKIKRLRKYCASVLTEWMKEPENMAYRDKRRQEGFTKWMAQKSVDG